MTVISRSVDFSKFARYRLMDGPTSIQHLGRLSKHVGGANIFVKREDLGGIGAGGNKLRKLEFLIGDALANGADTLITVGARQSNHARLTAAVAAKVGLKCELVLVRAVPRNDPDYSENGNIVLDNLFGVTIHDLDGTMDQVSEFAEKRVKELASDGRKVYMVPLGGSSTVGCLGYAECAFEISRQSEATGVVFDRIVVATGTGGMHAGLVAGYACQGLDPSIVNGFSIYADGDLARKSTFAKACDTAAMIDADLQLDYHSINVDASQLGTGYGMPTDQMKDAVRMMAQYEGVLLDPVYTGKAFAGMLEAIRRREYEPGENVLFVMSGGMPALFAYRNEFEAA